MNIAILYYDGFCEFEVVLVPELFRDARLIALAPENRPYTSEERQRYLPDATIADTTPNDIDLLVIPGGDPSSLFENQSLKNFLQAMDREKKCIAAICGGSFLLAEFGLLAHRRCTGGSEGITPERASQPRFLHARPEPADVVTDGHIVTATGKGYVELAFELARRFDLYPSEEEQQSAYRWFTNQQPCLP